MSLEVETVARDSAGTIIHTPSPDTEPDPSPDSDPALSLSLTPTSQLYCTQ